MLNSFGNNRNEPKVRVSRPGDVNSLTDMDLKCYHYPHALDWWREYMKDMGDKTQIVVCEVMGKAVGYAVWESFEDPKTDQLFIDIVRLGVIPRYRRQGLATLLLEAVENTGRRMRADSLTMNTVEIHCCPGDPDDVSVFMNNINFKTSGVIIRDFSRMYGEMRDAYQWVRRIM